MPTTVRLFLAINLDAAVRAAVYRDTEPLRAALESGAWVREALLHITLKFLGERPEQDVVKVREMVTAIAARHRALRFSLSGVGAFPNLARPRVVWIGTQRAHGLCEIAREIDVGCEGLGVPRERRPFQAHLTLGRMRRELDDGERAALAAASRVVRRPHDVEIRSVDLMQSRLAARGPEYTVLARIPLAES